jgi:hypothetical protein
VAAVADVARDLDAGHLRHLDVEEHEVGRAVLERLERRGAVSTEAMISSSGQSLRSFPSSCVRRIGSSSATMAVGMPRF